MGNYFETNKKKFCNGCGICAKKCPKHAITMIEDEEGFLYPHVDSDKCINCNLCKKICSNNELEENNSKSYIAYNLNENELKDSSSGGVFSVIARYVLQQQGIIFGVKWNDKLQAIHDYIENDNELKTIMGTKYVRSDLNNCYEKVEKFLLDGKWVLFTGTPCQCYSVKKYLGKPYDKLITCEIICHANPSPKVFEMYKKNLEKLYSKKIREIKFRSKENGWKNVIPIIICEDDTIIKDVSYYYAFVRDLINRPSCYNCYFCTTKRASDFTIGDMWGIDKIDNSVKDDDTGLSLFCVNTDKGEEILTKIKDKMFLKEVDQNLAFSYNHNSNIKYHRNRKKFFKKLKKGKINENNIIKYMNKYAKIPIYEKVFNKIKYKLSIN